MSEMMKPDEVGQAIVPVLACVLNQLCARNDRLPQKGVSKFHALRPPAISIKDYLHRVLKYAACSGECFVLALVYIDRLIQSNPTFVVNSLNIHRLLITSVMLAAKFFDDQYFNNAYYAKVGGVPCGEMNSLEVEFLFMTNFTLFVNTETYSQYYSELCNHVNNPNNHCACHQQKVPNLIVPELPIDHNINDIKALCIQTGYPFEELLLEQTYVQTVNDGGQGLSSHRLNDNGMSESPAIESRQLTSASNHSAYTTGPPMYPNPGYTHYPNQPYPPNAAPYSQYSAAPSSSSGYGPADYYHQNYPSTTRREDHSDEGAMITGSPPVNAM